MKIHLKNSATTICMCVLLSGCFGTIPSKPIVVNESKEGVILKVEQDGSFRLVNDQGVQYIPCGKDLPIQCPPISAESPRKLIGKISEVRASQPGGDKQQSLSPLSARSNQRTSSCEYVIEYEVEGRIVYFIASLCK